MYDYENALLSRGVRFPDIMIDGLNDSKQLTENQREKLAVMIERNALAYAVHFVDPKVIDEVNIYQASKLAMIEAIKKLSIVPEHILSDAMPLQEAGVPYTAIIKGDTLSASIAAGSIIAKVARDHFMVEMANHYPGYGFEKHKGYPTKAHIEALKSLGTTPIHRKTYKPVRDILEKQLSLNL